MTSAHAVTIADKPLPLKVAFIGFFVSTLALTALMVLVGTMV